MGVAGFRSNSGQACSRPSMRPAELVLQCFAERKGNQWQAFCLDFCLAAQGDTLSEVKEKLESMIAEYTYGALAGEDRDFGLQLLSRRAPLRDWLKYYWYLVLYKLGALHKEVRQLFTSLVPLEPSSLP